MKHWKRIIKIKIGNYIYEAPFVIEFQSSQGVNNISSSTVKLYNPSESTIALAMPNKESGRAKELQTIVVEAGYEEDYGICISGDITRAEVSTSGVDRILTMHVAEKAMPLSNIFVSQSWGSNVQAEQVIRDLLSLLGTPSDIVLGNNKTYPRGITVNKRLFDELKNMARDTDSRFFMAQGIAFFKPIKPQSTNDTMEISLSSGLLERPEMQNKKWKINTLFNYRVKPGDIISVKSSVFNNAKIKGVLKGRIEKLSHNFSVTNGYTRLEVAEV